MLDYVIRLSNNPNTREVYSLMIIVDKGKKREDIKINNKINKEEIIIRKTIVTIVFQE